MSHEESPRVLLVVPTLGQRLNFLRQCLSSIRTQSEPCTLIVVRPVNVAGVDALADEFGALTMDDPGSLPGAINLAVTNYASEHEFVNWLGDDDFLERDSLADVMAALDSDQDAVAAFGYCRYVTAGGETLWVSRAGAWAPKILSWGPDLIPQPGMLVRMSAWQAVRGLDTTYHFAFDLDLLLRLRKVGGLRAVNRIVAGFRWHEDSLTVSDRTTNIVESERAKRASLSPRLWAIAPLWEIPVRWGTRYAAYRLARRAQP